MTILTIMSISDAHTNLWTVAEAKAKLSRVIEDAQTRGPQTITRRGRRAAVVVDAEEWGRLVARHEARGRPIQAMDGLIAATAQVHGLTLVTRNGADFALSVKSVLNPWR